jgi:hypothetical protein
MTEKKNYETDVCGWRVRIIVREDVTHSVEVEILDRRDQIHTKHRGELFARGHIKWDGCCNIEFNTEQHMAHFCGWEEDMSVLAEVFKTMYLEASKVCPNADITLWDVDEPTHIMVLADEMHRVTGELVTLRDTLKRAQKRGTDQKNEIEALTAKFAESEKCRKELRREADDLGRRLKKRDDGGTQLKMAQCCHDVKNFLHAAMAGLEKEIMDVATVKKALGTATELVTSAQAEIVKELREG